MNAPTPFSPRLRAGSTALAWIAVALLAASSAGAESPIPRTPSTEGARVYVISPADGAVVKSPVTVRFGLKGMGVAPAGVDIPGTGHHHLIVDADAPATDRPIPADPQHIHFGGGQTETTIELSPGPHTLRLVLGDKLHIPHDPPVVSEPVKIVVE